MNNTDKKRFSIYLVFIWMFVIFPVSGVFTQSPANPKKAKARIGLEFFNNLTTGSYLKASVKTKIDRSYVPVAGEIVHFYLSGEKKEILLGQTMSNEKGEAILPLDKTLLNSTDTVYGHTFRAAIEGSKHFKNKTRALYVKEMNMDVVFSEDSSYQITALLTTPDSMGTMMPVASAKIKTYVKRLFSWLPLGEDIFSTNKSGLVELDFPNDIPGDEMGMLAVIVTLEDHEIFGNIILEKDLKWGLPITENEVISEGELWSARSNAPFYMIILVNGILIGIWFVIIYIIFQLFKIYKVAAAELSQQE